MIEPERFHRVWAMANSHTLRIEPIRSFVDEHLKGKQVIDPFAGECDVGTITNDLRPEFNTSYHMDSKDFLGHLASQGIQANGCLFDPPYSPRQIKECYNGVGLKMGALDAMRTNWKVERDLLNQILTSDAVIVSINWNSMGMGLKRGWEIYDILLVCHGVGHNDTICIAERRV